MNRIMIQAAALALVLGSAPAALADRAANADERAMIGAALEAQGYTSWGEIEYDDDGWEVDNAVGPDGRVYDLELDEAFNVIEQDLED